jgi:hypothetical protein
LRGKNKRKKKPVVARLNNGGVLQIKGPLPSAEQLIMTVQLPALLGWSCMQRIRIYMHKLERYIFVKFELSEIELNGETL